jgi:hypothetical protein
MDRISPDEYLWMRAGPPKFKLPQIVRVDGYGLSVDQKGGDLRNPRKEEAWKGTVF